MTKVCTRDFMSESIQIKILLGHSAQWRKKPTPEGFTHDWKMVVQGEEGQEIKHFVEKVVFHLHESFPRPKRVFKEPPYEVAESGYGSFMLPIEVFFRNKEEPRKVLFEYDLVLPNLHDPPINEVRSECLTFQNPSEEFKKKLLMAGATGTGVDGGSIQIPKKKKHQGDNAGSEPPKKKKKKDSSSDSQSSSGEESENNEVTAVKKGMKEDTGITWDATNLKQLHKQLNAVQDPSQLQEIVNIVESTQIYQLTASTFDFDLCKLDEATLNKLHTLVESFS